MKIASYNCYHEVMNEGDLFCNARHCHRVLNTTAWVTFCSHIFCEEDGNAHLNQIPCVCPACGAQLASKSDVMRVDLDPSEQFRNMVLAGFKPDIIMDICSRALNFWTYQMDKERQRQIKKVELMKTQIVEVEEFYEKILRDTNAEMAAANRQLESERKEREEILQQKEIMSAKLGDKSRQFQKLKNLYDSLRRRVNLPLENYGLEWNHARGMGSSHNVNVPYSQNLHPRHPLTMGERAHFPSSSSCDFNSQVGRTQLSQQQSLGLQVATLPPQNISSVVPNHSGLIANHRDPNINRHPVPLILHSKNNLSQAIALPSINASNNYQSQGQLLSKDSFGNSRLEMQDHISASFPTTSDFKFQPRCGNK